MKTSVPSTGLWARPGFGSGWPAATNIHSGRCLPRGIIMALTLNMTQVNLMASIHRRKRGEGRGGVRVPPQDLPLSMCLINLMA